MGGRARPSWGNTAEGLSDLALLRLQSGVWRDGWLSGNFLGVRLVRVGNSAPVGVIIVFRKVRVVVCRASSHPCRLAGQVDSVESGRKTGEGKRFVDQSSPSPP